MRVLPILFVAALVGVPVWVVAADPATKPAEANREAKPKEFLRFDGTTLVLAYQQEKDGDTLKEYIPEGETLERWTKLAGLYEYPNLSDPQAVVDAFVKRLTERNADIPYEVKNDTKTGAVVIDFFIWPEEAASPETAEYVEYNVFKYQTKPGGGLTAQQYAVRCYKDIPNFLSNFRQDRDRLVDEMTGEGLVMTSGKSRIVE